MRLLACYGIAGLLALLSVPLGRAQSTQGIVLGRITDSVTGLPLAASVTCRREDTGFAANARSDSSGNYALPALSPGRYILTVELQNYQSQQARAVDLPVAGRLELNFRLRPLFDIFEAGQYRSWLLDNSQLAVAFYGPDVDTSRSAVFDASQRSTAPLDESRSDVITREEIDQLPLTGRDVYTMLLLLPGVTADTSAARGLGYSVNGQRPSSANYLLDGVPNNNQLVTGPLGAAVPEFVQEYRVSTTNYSAEYGSTSGFIANAISRSGSNEFHGAAFLWLRNQGLDAAGFQQNAQGFGRASYTEWQPGVLASGAAVPNRLFLFGGWQQRRFNGNSDPQTFVLPTASYVASTVAAGGFPGTFLSKYLPAVQPTGLTNTGSVVIHPPIEINRYDGLFRADYSTRDGLHRAFGRLALDAIDEPQYGYDPYQQFSTRFQQKDLSAAFGLTSRIRSASMNDFRLSRTGESIRLDTPASPFPQLGDEGDRGQFSVNSVILPGPNIGDNSLYNYWSRAHNLEVLDNYSWIKGRHAAKVGGGFLQRNIDLRLDVSPQGQLSYPDLNALAANHPDSLSAEIYRQGPGGPVTSPERQYRYRQFYAFAQDSFHATSHLMFDFGLRYDYYGAPVNTGSQKDLLLQLGPGSDPASRFAGAFFALPPTSGGQQIYSSLSSNWAARAGMAWDIFGTGRTLFRASYGIFYDPPYDNLWEGVIQNRYQTGGWSYSANQVVPLPQQLSSLEAAGTPQTFSTAVPTVLFQSNLRAARTQSAFTGVQQAVSPGVVFELDALASRGRGLVTTDAVNRGSASPDFVNMHYRANQGSSDYTAMVAALRFHREAWSGQISYTWSRSIDNQSEPLNGTFLSFNQLAASTQTAPSTYFSAFTQQFMSNQDRGNSDFDQRQNLVFFATWRLPAPSGSKLNPLLRNWTVSALGAVRSGLPFSVYSTRTVGNGPQVIFVNERPDLVNPSQAYASSPTNGGRILLNSAAFAPPQPNKVGTSGRNEFTGPGLFDADLSLARTLRGRQWRESLAVTLRADAYNFLNHANLNNPSSFYRTSTFGQALYGRTEINNGFPLLQPLSEAARQIQVSVQVRF
jgi:Carboxypeptidase regulatory-like domain/TonB-dependent Receptor Plug Domain